MYILVSSSTNNDLNDIDCPEGSTFFRCYAVGENGIILTSADFGDTWTNRTSGLSTGDLTEISCVDVDTCYVIGNGTHKTIKTVDGGRNWTSLSTSYYPFTSISCVGSSTTCYAGGETCTGCDYRIEKTVDGGETWNPLLVSTEPLLEYGNYHIDSIFCTSINTCYVAASIGISDSSIYKTTNGGSVWTRVYQLSSDDGGLLENIYCTSQSICSAVGGLWGFGGIVIDTFNGGISWDESDVSLNSDSGLLSTIYCSGSSPSYSCFAAGYDGTFSGDVYNYVAKTIFRKTNIGSDWIMQYEAATIINGISCISPSWCYAVGDNGYIVRTTTGGE